MVRLIVFYFFFFSSRRRHTRYIGDWSSDVCSSDLIGVAIAAVAGVARDPEVATMLIGPPRESAGLPVTATVALVVGADLRGRRWLGPAELALTVAIVCALPLGSLTVPSAAYAVLVGTT